MKFFGAIIFLSCIIYIQALKFDNPKSDILPTKEICGQQPSGENNQFPWVVYLPLSTRTYNPDAHVRCAGVLINKRYVAIYKSCLQFSLNKVHIGVYDTSKSETCNGSDCSPVEEVEIEKKIYDDNKHIVLLRLAKDVEFTNKIHPICLPFEELKRAEIGETVYSSGWGLTIPDAPPVNSLTKKTVKEVVVKTEDCQKAGHFSNAKDLAEYICVKVQNDSPNKPCSGDEGSPIMYSSNGQWVLEGIMGWLFEKNAPCAINEPAGGAKITEEILQWIIDNIEA